MTKEEALEKIAASVPTVVDLTASDLDMIAEELYDDYLAVVNLAREALGLLALPKVTYEEEPDTDEDEEEDL